MSGWVQRLGRGVRAAAPYAFTLAVIAACCVVFVAEFVRDGLGLLNFLDEISLDTLYAMGGLLVMPGQAVGEWSRLVTATFLHADIAHLARNVAVIAGAGIALERMAGKGGFLIAVAVSLFAGNAAALRDSRMSELRSGTGSSYWVHRTLGKHSDGFSGNSRRAPAALLAREGGLPGLWDE